MEEKIAIPTEIREEITAEKDQPGALLSALRNVQNHFGYIPRQAAIDISSLLNIPLARLYGFISFYQLFKLKKPGRHNISICNGTACYMKGSEDIVQGLEEILGIGINNTTEDGEFSIELVMCLGCCGMAPAITINGEVYGNVKKADLPDIIAKLSEKKS